MKRFAAFALLAIFAFASHPEEIIFQSYSLSGSEREALVETAKQMAPAGAKLHNVWAYRHGGISAETIFGPYDVSDSSFSLDVITCNRQESPNWRCDSRKTRHFMLFGTSALPVEVGDGVSWETARIIAAHDAPSCRMHGVEWKEGAGGRYLLSAPSIHLDAKSGKYSRHAESCVLEFEMKGALIEQVKEYAELQ